MQEIYLINLPFENFKMYIDDNVLLINLSAFDKDISESCVFLEYLEINVALVLFENTPIILCHGVY